mmetsp:Transcript_24297/g.49920  ORF Transcript_24297/g.49920 Transcript_24297/m.49920 type:complete len:226 (-) Transcript_24297:684-1361(-)
MCCEMQQATYSHCHCLILMPLVQLCWLQQCGSINATESLPNSRSSTRSGSRLRAVLRFAFGRSRWRLGHVNHSAVLLFRKNHRWSRTDGCCDGLLSLQPVPCETAPCARLDSDGGLLAGDRLAPISYLTGDVPQLLAGAEGMALSFADQAMEVSQTCAVLFGNTHVFAHHLVLHFPFVIKAAELCKSLHLRAVQKSIAIHVQALKDELDSILSILLRLQSLLVLF